MYCMYIILLKSPPLPLLLALLVINSCICPHFSVDPCNYVCHMPIYIYVRSCLYNRVLPSPGVEVVVSGQFFRSHIGTPHTQHE